MKKVLRTCHVLFCLWMVSSSLPAFPQESYKLEFMLPPLGRQWYLHEPQGIAIDRSANVYVADTGNHRIQKFDSNGDLINIWGTYGHEEGQLLYPMGVAADSSGNVYVADFTNRIQKFDSNGNFVLKWGSSGTGESQFSYPTGIAVDSLGNVYIADAQNNRIQKFDSNGNFITKWGSEGTGDGQFTSPTKVAVDSSGMVYVTDLQNNRIQKFNSSGKFITKWGSEGTGDGQFNHPNGVAVDSSGMVYVVDVINNRIQKFDAYGNFIMKWSSPCSGGIAVDPSGNAYVLDAWGSRVQKFDSNGILIEKWISWGNDDGEFSYPRGVTIDSSGNLFVADSVNYRIQEFDSEGKFITEFSVLAGPMSGEPFGIALGSSKNIYAVISLHDSYCNVARHHIEKFDSSGKLITIWDNTQTMGAGWVAVDSSENVYISNSGWNSSKCGRVSPSILKLDSNGKFITAWGPEGTGDGQFTSPAGVGVDSLGNVYVADPANHRIQKFDSNGNFITKWGSEGTGDGQFTSPTEVAVDSSGYVYIAEGCRIQKFDSNGNFITKWGSCGVEPYHFDFIGGLAVDSTGGVYVVDTYNHRIQKFSPGGQESISTPTRPRGNINGTIGENYTYSTGVSFSDIGHPVNYYFDWGDETYFGWSSSTSASKSWSALGIYSVRAKARCTIDTSIESDWSDSLTVTISNPSPDLTGSWTTPLAQTCRTTGKNQRCSLRGTFTVNNIGNNDASSTSVKFYLSNNATRVDGDAQLKSVSTGKLKPGKSKVINVNLNLAINQTATGKYIILVIDRDNLVAEIDENNNTITYGPIP
jgi:tripartite motif-containing protein 71